MSIIFGVRKQVGKTVNKEELLTLGAATRRYALDGTFVDTSGHLGMGFQPYYTHERSRLESGPVSDHLGNWLVFDGRLDNQAELRKELAIGNPNTPDSMLALAAFQRWGESCFSRFDGDWALALWSRWDGVTYLARDHAGTRTLYFQNTNGILRWSTYLETFFANGEQYPLDEQYAASFLCGLPIRDFTPYQGIRAVPPAHYLAIKGNTVTATAHWSPIAKDRILYKSDTEYEEHLFTLFRQAVARRSGPGAPILAELSGGMDSTSIVCMSDHIRKAQGADASGLLDTISYFDPHEPNWNEEPYFSVTEERRGKRGIHLETSAAVRTFEPLNDSRCQDATPTLSASVWPGMDRMALEREEAREKALGDYGYRTILSGTGGDEVLGGVPTPLPELADLMVSGNLYRLLTQGKAWCLSNRSPLLYMLYHTARFATGLYLPHSAHPAVAPPWVTQRLKTQDLTRTRKAEDGSRFGIRPSALCNGEAWWTMLETLPHQYPALLKRYEYRYPFLDRDLVDCLYRIPREQIIRPGFRRSLMRRAFAELIPPEILNRRRKAYIAHGPLVALRVAQQQIEAILADSATVAHGFVDQKELQLGFQRLLNGQDAGQLSVFINTLLLDLWLRNAPLSNPYVAADTDAIVPIRRSTHEEIPVQAV